MADFFTRVVGDGAGYQIYKKTRRGSRPVGKPHASKADANKAIKRLGSGTGPTGNQSLKGGIDQASKTSRQVQRAGIEDERREAQRRARGNTRLARKAAKTGSQAGGVALRGGLRAVPGVGLAATMLDSNPANAGEDQIVARQNMLGDAVNAGTMGRAYAQAGAPTPQPNPMAGQRVPTPQENPALRAPPAINAAPRPPQKPLDLVASMMGGAPPVPQPRPTDASPDVGSTPTPPPKPSNPADNIPPTPMPNPQENRGLTQQSNNATTFGQAFAQARAAGKQQFEWNGQLYNTRLASESQANWMKRFA